MFVRDVIWCRFAVASLSLSLYVSSLFLPVLYLEREKPVNGSTLLVAGWWGVLMLNPAWFANPAYFVAIGAFLRGAYPFSRRVSFVAIGLGLCSLYAKEWWSTEARGTPIMHLGVGFYVWFVSMAALLASTFLTDNANSLR